MLRFPAASAFVLLLCCAGVISCPSGPPTPKRKCYVRNSDSNDEEGASIECEDSTNSCHSYYTANRPGTTAGCGSCSQISSSLYQSGGCSDCVGDYCNKQTAIKCLYLTDTGVSSKKCYGINKCYKMTSSTGNSIGGCGSCSLLRYLGTCSECNTDNCNTLSNIWCKVRATGSITTKLCKGYDRCYSLTSPSDGSVKGGCGFCTARKGICSECKENHCNTIPTVSCKQISENAISTVSCTGYLTCHNTTSTENGAVNGGCGICSNRFPGRSCSDCAGSNCNRIPTISCNTLTPTGITSLTCRGFDTCYTLNSSADGRVSGGCGKCHSKLGSGSCSECTTDHCNIVPTKHCNVRTAAGVDSVPCHGYDWCYRTVSPVDGSVSGGCGVCSADKTPGSCTQCKGDNCNDIPTISCTASTGTGVTDKACVGYDKCYMTTSPEGGEMKAGCGGCGSRFPGLSCTQCNKDTCNKLPNIECRVRNKDGISSKLCHGHNKCYKTVAALDGEVNGGCGGCNGRSVAGTCSDCDSDNCNIIPTTMCQVATDTGIVSKACYGYSKCYSLTDARPGEVPGGCGTCGTKLPAGRCSDCEGDRCNKLPTVSCKVGSTSAITSKMCYGFGKCHSYNYTGDGTTRGGCGACNPSLKDGKCEDCDKSECNHIPSIKCYTLEAENYNTNASTTCEGYWQCYQYTYGKTMKLLYSGCGACMESRTADCTACNSNLCNHHGYKEAVRVSASQLAEEEVAAGSQVGSLPALLLLLLLLLAGAESGCCGMLAGLG